MNERQYRETVIKMRAHQDGWFREHRQSDLIEARRLERIIDAENRRWLDLSKDVRPTDEETQDSFEGWGWEQMMKENGHEAEKGT